MKFPRFLIVGFMIVIVSCYPARQLPRESNQIEILKLIEGFATNIRIILSQPRLSRLRREITDLSENEIADSRHSSVKLKNPKNVTTPKKNTKNSDVEELDVKQNKTEVHPTAPETKPQKQENEENDEEFDDDDDTEEQSFLTMLISSFLGSLSTPEGGVDVDAVVALIGSLSTMRDDGTYDFSGLRETLMNFLGGGNFDVGAFVGGLLGAVIQGVANPPGAKGAGKLTGSIVSQLLPALSAPPPAEDNGSSNGKPQLDIVGFLKGFLGKLFSSSSGPKW